MQWGKRKENMIRRTNYKHKRKLLWKNHDSLFIAIGHWQVRLMKWWRNG